jgi:prophage maintenance system killer protein
MEWLTVEDLLLIAEVVLDVPGEDLARATKLEALRAAVAAAGRQADVADSATVLCHRLLQDRPLPCGNKPVALLALLELVSRNQGVWVSPHGGERELATTIEQLSSGELFRADFRAWVRAHVR